MSEGTVMLRCVCLTGGERRTDCPEHGDERLEALGCEPDIIATLRASILSQPHPPLREDQHDEPREDERK